MAASKHMTRRTRAMLVTAAKNARKFSENTVSTDV
jgi:hypothetical protein